MKRTISFVLAFVMLLSILPFAAYAANPVANNLTVTNAIDGVCGATVELSWQKSPADMNLNYGYAIKISKSYDGSNYTQVAYITNNVNKTTTYTYSCVAEDAGRTVYFGVQYGQSETTVFEMRTVSVTIQGSSAGDKTRYQDMLLHGLADPTYTKSATKYDTLKFVAGTAVTWDCLLYTLNATAVKVSGSKVTFTVTFESKIPESVTAINGGWYGYHIHISTNVASYDYIPGDTMQFTVDTAKVDSIGTSAAGGFQFVTIRIDKTEKNDELFPLYASNAYFADIVKNRDVYPENAGYITEVDLEDTYALSYYVKPSYKLNSGTYQVTKTSITLGTYGFASAIQYRVKGSKTWKEKSFAKNKKIVLSGLKANTVYEIHPLCKIPYTDPETGKSMICKAEAGSAFTLTTVINVKPTVTSIKASKAKYGKKTIPGYWETHGAGGSTWHPAETFYTVSYTLTIKVKNVPKNVKGLYRKAGGGTDCMKGKKTTYTLKTTYQSRTPLKGKTLSCKLAYTGNVIGKSAVGIGPAKTCSYRLP